jgi:hypothetical protein
MKFSFPWLAAGIGFLLAMVLIQAGALGAPEAMGLPLLTMLFISEFGFFVTATGSFLAGKRLLHQKRNWSDLLLNLTCAALAIAFFSLGIWLWQGRFG